MTDWSDLVHRHGPAVWRTAYRLLGHEADAADCFQETFLEAVRMARRNRVDHWPAMLRKIATARALDRLRRRISERRRRTEFLHQVDHAAVSVSHASPADDAQAAELADALRTALAELPAPQSQAFCLCCVEGMTYEEAANTMNVKTTHIGVLIHRARARLRERLEPPSL